MDSFLISNLLFKIHRDLYKMGFECIIHDQQTQYSIMETIATSFVVMVTNGFSQVNVKRFLKARINARKYSLSWIYM